MKYLSQLMLVIAVTFSFASETTATVAVTGETPLGPHSAQKFALVKHLVSRRTIDPGALTTIALVLTVEQKMNGNQQEIAAKASTHKDGPHGAMQSALGVQVRILQPGNPVASTPRTTAEVGEVNVSSRIPAPGGKYKTVVAEATINSPNYPDTKVSLTIPGDK